VDRDIHLIFVMNLKRNQNEKAKLIKKINKIIGKLVVLLLLMLKLNHHQY
jgi:fumarate reductase subunit D